MIGGRPKEANANQDLELKNDEVCKHLGYKTKKELDQEGQGKR